LLLLAVFGESIDRSFQPLVHRHRLGNSRWVHNIHNQSINSFYHNSQVRHLTIALFFSFYHRNWIIISSTTNIFNQSINSNWNIYLQSTIEIYT